jgi:hypothetical protein
VLLEQIFEEGTVRSSKTIRASAQRAMVNGKVAIPRSERHHIRLPI